MTNTIESERRRLGLTQAQLGEKIGKDRSTIGRWEADPSRIEARYLYALSELFQCSIDYLLGLTPERTSRALTQPVA